MHFKPYPWGRKFLIESDHRPLRWLFTLKDPSSRPYRWKIKIREFYFDIKYVKGKTNYVADALSPIEINSNEDVKSDLADADNDRCQDEIDNAKMYSNKEDPIFTLKETRAQHNKSVPTQQILKTP